MIGRRFSIAKVSFLEGGVGTGGHVVASAISKKMVASKVSHHWEKKQVGIKLNGEKELLVVGGDFFTMQLNKNESNWIMSPSRGFFWI